MVDCNACVVFRRSLATRRWLKKVPREPHLQCPSHTPKLDIWRRKRPLARAWLQGVRDSFIANDSAHAHPHTPFPHAQEKEEALKKKKTQCGGAPKTPVQCTHKRASLPQTYAHANAHTQLEAGGSRRPSHQQSPLRLPPPRSIGPTSFTPTNAPATHMSQVEGGGCCVPQRHTLARPPPMESVPHSTSPRRRAPPEKDRAGI
jgi:hypothetical protein